MDKVQKIREEVERLQNELIQEREKGVGSDVDDACILELQNVLTFIDSLQKEPVSVWHNASEKPNIKEKSGIFVITSLNGEYIGSRYYNYNDITINFGNYDKWAYLNDLLNLSNAQRTIKDWKEEPASEDLEEAAIEYCGGNKGSDARVRTGFIMGAKWQKENLWKSADGNDLPEIDKEVIALLDNGEVVFAHRPDPKGWDGKSITTGKVEHYTPKTFGKGGWNIPNVRCWLNVGLPKEIEL